MASWTARMKHKHAFHWMWKMCTLPWIIGLLWDCTMNGDFRKWMGLVPVADKAWELRCMGRTTEDLVAETTHSPQRQWPWMTRLKGGHAAWKSHTRRHLVICFRVKWWSLSNVLVLASKTKKQNMNVTSPADVCKNLKVFGGVFFFFDLIITFRISKHVSVSDIKNSYNTVQEEAVSQNLPQCWPLHQTTGINISIVVLYFVSFPQTSTTLMWPDCKTLQYPLTVGGWGKKLPATQPSKGFHYVGGPPRFTFYGAV